MQNFYLPATNALPTFLPKSLFILKMQNRVKLNKALQCENFVNIIRWFQHIY